MRFAPLPAQVVLAACLAYVALKACVAHQRTADLYAEQLRLRDSSPSGEAVPLSFVRLASKEASSADRSFNISLGLSLAIIVVALFQLFELWFSVVARKEQPRGSSKHDQNG
jgi:hypothetical protein